MKIDIKGVHYEVTDTTREFVNQKLEKLSYAKDLIVDLIFTMTKETHDWKAEVTCNFQWGVRAHLDETAFNLHQAVEKLIDRLDMKVSKEKEKVQDHHHVPLKDLKDVEV